MCIETMTQWGTRCGESSSFEVALQNVCDFPVMVQVCVEGTDSCNCLGPDLYESGQSIDFGTTAYYVCSGTGNYVLYVGTPSDGPQCYPEKC
jgi:hypothetical protein